METMKRDEIIIEKEKRKIISSMLPVIKEEKV
jgi:hypothetical protein